MTDITRENFYEIVHKYENVLVDLLEGHCLHDIHYTYCRFVNHCHTINKELGVSCDNCLFFPGYCVKCYHMEYREESITPSALYAVTHEFKNRTYKIAHCLRFFGWLAEIEKERGWEK